MTSSISIDSEKELKEKWRINYVSIHNIQREEDGFEQLIVSMLPTQLSDAFQLKQ